MTDPTHVFCFYLVLAAACTVGQGPSPFREAFSSMSFSDTTLSPVFL